MDKYMLFNLFIIKKVIDSNIKKLWWFYWMWST